jgi:hypothetical protein
MFDPLKVENINDVRTELVNELAKKEGLEKAKELINEIDNIELASALQKGLYVNVKKGYWFCPTCWEFHPYSQKLCNLTENSKDRTEDGYEEIYRYFDPESYEDDDAHLNFPHTKVFRWLASAERVYNVKLRMRIEPLTTIATHYKIKSININDFRKPISDFEKALRKFEMQRFNPAYYAKNYATYMKATYGKSVNIKVQSKEEFWSRWLKNARTSTELEKIEKEYNDRINNGDTQLRTIAAYYGLQSIGLDGQTVLERELRKQELSKLMPETYGEPLSEERFWSWAEAYGKQLQTTDI